MMTRGSVGRLFVAMGICLVLLSFGAYTYGGDCWMEECESGGTCAGGPAPACTGTCVGPAFHCYCDCKVGGTFQDHCNCIASVLN